MHKTFTAILCVAAALLSAISCVENDRTLGSGMLPDESILQLGVKTFDLPVTNRVSDSVQAANDISMLIGTMHDPTFGTVTSNSASYIVPYSDSTDFGDNPQLISAYLNLSIDSTYYLDSDQKGIHQRIKIYKLTSPLDSNLTFCNSISPDKYDPVPITVSDPIIYGEGTIKIDLRDEFAEELLATTPEEFEDVTLFLKRIYGLYIEIEPAISTSSGRMNYLDMGNSTINLNYTMNDPDRGITDLDTTESFAFGYYSYQAYNFFSTGSESLTSETPGDILYLEGLSGVKPHISATDLKTMINDWIAEEGLENQTIILSRAELVFPYEMPQDYEKFNMELPSAIYAFTNSPWATDSLRYYTILPEVYSVSNRGDINRSLNEYSMDITDYMQDLLRLDISEIDSDMDLWIAPMKYKVNLLNDRVYEFDNYNYNKILLNGPTADRKPTLSITYGILK